MKVSKRQLRRIIKEERARLLSEQPISGEQAAQMQSDEEKRRMQSEADHIRSAMHDAALAADLEMEMKDVHTPEFIALWEPGF